MNEIPIADISVPIDQRTPHPAQVKMLAEKIEREGYNPSYPITLEFQEGQAILVDGGHRMEAALQAGLTTIPYLELPPETSRIRHSIRCNVDGSDTRPDDVFDYASRVQALSEAKWSGQQIAEELGWGPTLVSYYKSVCEKLHPRVWVEAREGFTKNGEEVKDGEGEVVNSEFTKVNWTETHFRSLLQHLPYNPQEPDRAIYRAQLAVIRDAQGRSMQGDKRFGQTEKKVTAKWIGAAARKQAYNRAGTPREIRDQPSALEAMNDVKMLNQVQSALMEIANEEFTHGQGSATELVG